MSIEAHRYAGEAPWERSGRGPAALFKTIETLRFCMTRIVTGDLENGKCLIA